MQTIFKYLSTGLLWSCGKWRSFKQQQFMIPAVWAINRLEHVMQGIYLEAVSFHRWFLLCSFWLTRSSMPSQMMSLRCRLKPWGGFHGVKCIGVVMGTLDHRCQENSRPSAAADGWSRDGLLNVPRSNMVRPGHVLCPPWSATKWVEGARCADWDMQKACSH